MKLEVYDLLKSCGVKTMGLYSSQNKTGLILISLFVYVGSSVSALSPNIPLRNSTEHKYWVCDGSSAIRHLDI